VSDIRNTGFFFNIKHTLERYLNALGFFYACYAVLGFCKFIFFVGISEKYIASVFREIHLI
jgi:hypothetical protein